MITLDDIALALQAEEDALVADQPVSTEVWELKHALFPNYPQLQLKGTGGNWNYSDPRSVHRIIGRPDLRLASETPPFGTMPLAPGAQLTEVLSSSPLSRGLIVSERAKRVFRQFVLGEHRFFPLLIESDDGIHEYDWLQFVNHSTEAILFEQTEFFVQEGFSANSSNSTPTRVASSDAMAQLQGALSAAQGAPRYLEPKRVVLRRLQGAPDLFQLGFDTRYYVTSPLKAALEYHAITGLTFKPTRRVLFESEI